MYIVRYNGSNSSEGLKIGAAATAAEDIVNVADYILEAAERNSVLIIHPAARARAELRFYSSSAQAACVCAATTLVYIPPIVYLVYITRILAREYIARVSVYIPYLSAGGARAKAAAAAAAAAVNRGASSVERARRRAECGLSPSRSTQCAATSRAGCSSALCLSLSLSISRTIIVKKA